MDVWIPTRSRTEVLSKSKDFGQAWHDRYGCLSKCLIIANSYSLQSNHALQSQRSSKCSVGSSHKYTYIWTLPCHQGVGQTPSSQQWILLAHTDMDTDSLFDCDAEVTMDTGQSLVSLLVYTVSHIAKKEEITTEQSCRKKGEWPRPGVRWAFCTMLQCCFFNRSTLVSLSTKGTNTLEGSTSMA